MRCPACGCEEKEGSVCSKCHTPLPVKLKKPEARPPSPSVPPTPSKTPSPAELPKEKHRRRPLMDLDLTVPELETEEEKKQSDESKKDEKS